MLKCRFDMLCELHVVFVVGGVEVLWNLLLNLHNLGSCFSEVAFIDIKPLHRMTILSKDAYDLVQVPPVVLCELLGTIALPMRRHATFAFECEILRRR